MPGDKSRSESNSNPIRFPWRDLPNEVRELGRSLVQRSATEAGGVGQTATRLATALRPTTRIGCGYRTTCGFAGSVGAVPVSHAMPVRLKGIVPYDRSILGILILLKSTVSHLAHRQFLSEVRMNTSTRVATLIPKKFVEGRCVAGSRHQAFIKYRFSPSANR